MSWKTLVFALLVFFIFSFLFRTDNSFDQDLGRHIKLGEIIIKTHQVPKENLFSYTYPQFPFINHHYLFEVLIYLGNQYLEISALLIFKIMIILTAVGLTLSITSKSFSPLTLPVSFIFLHVLRERTDLRPEIFSFFFTALSYFILERFTAQKSRLIYILPAVQLLWVNTHIYFPVGLALQAIFLIYLTHIYLRSRLKGGKLKLLVVIFGLSVAFSLLNPNGLQGFFYPLTIFGNYGYTVAENQNLFLLESLNFHDLNFLFVKLSAFIILASILVGLFRRRLDIKNLLLCTFGLGLALFNIRSFPYLVFISLPATFANLGLFKFTKLNTFLSAAFAVILLAESFYYLNGDYYRFTNSDTAARLEAAEHGKKSLDFIFSHNLPSPLFNNFDIGSYIIYRSFPKYRVFVDGRPEGYPKEFFQQIYIPAQQDPQNFQELDKKIGFGTIIFSHTDQTPWGQSFLTSITKNPAWTTIYLDDFMIVLVKTEVAGQKQLQSVNLADLTPESYRLPDSFSYARISIFLLNTGNSKAAERFAQKSVELFPDSPIGNALLANLTGQSSDPLQILATQRYYLKAQSNIWW